MPDLPEGAEPATEASAEVVLENGQWAVYLTVIFDDGVVRRRIQHYRTRRLAEIAAEWCQRSANRDFVPRE